MQFKSHKMGIKRHSQLSIFYQLKKQSKKKTKQTKHIENTTMPLITTTISSAMFSLILLVYLS